MLFRSYLVILRRGKVIFFGKTEVLLLQSRATITAIPQNPEDMAKLHSLVESAGHQARIDSKELHIHANPEWGGELNKLAFENGIVLREITPVRATLEETFFELTEEAR